MSLDDMIGTFEEIVEHRRTRVAQRLEDNTANHSVNLAFAIWENSRNPNDLKYIVNELLDNRYFLSEQDYLTHTAMYGQYLSLVKRIPNEVCYEHGQGYLKFGDE